MNMVLIENTAGSSQVITIIEEFAGHSVSRDLNPGENTRIPVGSSSRSWCARPIPTTG
jgi:hypothetical protein